MTRATTPRTPSAAFAVVEKVGLTLPGVAVATKNDGATQLKLGGCFIPVRAEHDPVPIRRPKRNRVVRRVERDATDASAVQQPEVDVAFHGAAHDHATAVG